MKKFGMWLLPLSTCVLGWPAESGKLTAAEYWVWASGDNAANGSQDQPFRTIQRGVEAAAPGDTVYVHAGRYEEHVNVTSGKSGEPGKAAAGSEVQDDHAEHALGVILGGSCPAYGSLFHLVPE